MIAAPAGSQVKRRAFLAEAGDAPLFTHDPLQFLDRFDSFVEATGLPPERVLASPVVSFPIPVPVKNDAGTLARWSEVNPEMLWHPLFWMPFEVALRYQYPVIDDATGGNAQDFEVESDDNWAIRVALVMSISGMYDQANGTWLDVLAYWGLDINDPVDLARVQMWQQGHPDPVLDSIDLTPLLHLDTPAPDWSFHSARELAAAAVPAQWSLSARSLLATFQQQLAYRGNTDPVRRELISVLGATAKQALRTIPADDETGLSPADVIDVILAQAADPAVDTSPLLDELLLLLAETHEDYEPYLAAFAPDTLEAAAVAAAGAA